MYDLNKPLSIQWELNNICNLMCPQCVRNVIKDGKLQWRYDDLNKVDTTLPTFRTAYKNIRHPVSHIRFIGNLSEPVLSKDFLPICKFLKTETDTAFQVSTHGSVRTPGYWRKLGKIFNGNPKNIIFFSVDGVGNESLQNYRIGANFDKIMENAKAFIEGGGKAIWRMIIFKHNQHQIEEARALAESLGFWEFISIQTQRRHHMNEVYEYRGRKRILENQDLAPKWNDKVDKNQPPEILDIQCKYKEINSFYVDYLKRVWLCCYIPNKKHFGRQHEWYAKYNDDMTNSLVHKTFDKIMENEFYDTIQESWNNSDMCLSDCKKFCSLSTGVTRQSKWFLGSLAQSKASPLTKRYLFRGSEDDNL